MIALRLFVCRNRWGGEDDELYCRVVKKKLTIQSPLRYKNENLCLATLTLALIQYFYDCSGTITDLEEMGLIEKLDTLRSTKWKCTVMTVDLWK